LSSPLTRPVQIVRPQTAHPQSLRGPYDFVVVSNRLPVDRVADDDGNQGWRRSPGGLVTALAPVMEGHDGAWIGWHGAPDEELAPFDNQNMHLVPVPLSSDEVELYYEGFSNATLWPLYHDVIAPPEFHRTWWDSYHVVNMRFAEAAAAASAEGATVWVQDYQLQLVPQYLRVLRPDLVIGFFNHIPFPSPEIFAQLPWRQSILEGLLGADLIGFQRPSDTSNFLRCTRRFLGATVKARQVSVDSPVGGAPRVSRAEPFPISIDVARIQELAQRPDVIARAKRIREDLGNPETVLLGVDRLDYTKGITHRLKAYSELLHDGALLVDDAALIQVASPSRERVESYRLLREEVDGMVGRINGQFDTMQLSAPQLPRGGNGGAVPGCRRHAGHRPARWHEPGGQGVRGRPGEQHRRPGVERIHRRRGPAQGRPAGQSARHRRAQGDHRQGRPPQPGGVGPADALDAPAGARPRRPALVTGLPGHAGGQRRQRQRTLGMGEDWTVPAQLRDAVERLAAAERLLVALDFDGTMSPLVPRPEDARPLPGSAAAFAGLARLGRTTTALISGRALASLRLVANPPAEALLVGSHGAELWLGPDSAPLLLTDSQAESLRRTVEVLESTAAAHLGTAVEYKPAGAVLHTRQAETATGDAAIAAARTALAPVPGVFLSDGKRVLEATVVRADKGDEHAFAALGPGDVGIKVGVGDTAAAFRIPSPGQLPAVLELLLEARQQA
jgi:trehalose-6-phosphate synthase/trehalose-6-phosphatase